MKTASQRTQKGVFDQTKRLNKYKELQETPRTLVQTSTIDMHTHHAASTHNIYTHRSYQHAHKKHLHNPMWAEIHTRVGSKNTHTHTHLRFQVWWCRVSVAIRLFLVSQNDATEAILNFLTTLPRKDSLGQCHLLVHKRTWLWPFLSTLLSKLKPILKQ